MKAAILGLLALIPMVASVALFGWVESCANMVEMLLLPFTPAGKTAGDALACGGPFLVLLIGLGAAVFMGLPLFASVVAAWLGGRAIGQSRGSVSGRVAFLTIAVAVASTIALVLFATQSGSLIPDRPANRPKTPAALLACVAGLNAALSSSAATLVLRRITSRQTPPPISQV